MLLTLPAVICGQGYWLGCSYSLAALTPGSLGRRSPGPGGGGGGRGVFHKQSPSTGGIPPFTRSRCSGGSCRERGFYEWTGMPGEGHASRFPFPGESRAAAGGVRAGSPPPLFCPPRRREQGGQRRSGARPGQWGGLAGAQTPALQPLAVPPRSPLCGAGAPRGGRRKGGRQPGPRQVSLTGRRRFQLCPPPLGRGEEQTCWSLTGGGKNHPAFNPLPTQLGGRVPLPNPRC